MKHSIKVQTDSHASLKNGPKNVRQRIRIENSSRIYRGDRLEQTLGRLEQRPVRAAVALALAVAVGGRRRSGRLPRLLQRLLERALDQRGLGGACGVAFGAEAVHLAGLEQGHFGEAAKGVGARLLCAIAIGTEMQSANASEMCNGF